MRLLSKNSRQNSSPVALFKNRLKNRGCSLLLRRPTSNQYSHLSSSKIPWYHRMFCSLSGKYQTTSFGFLLKFFRDNVYVDSASETSNTYLDFWFSSIFLWRSLFSWSKLWSPPQHVVLSLPARIPDINLMAGACSAFSPWYFSEYSSSCSEFEILMIDVFALSAC